ncbi:CRISPR-associated protein Cmr3 [Clostridium sp. MSJ-4]|uniref:CRISPR-associated protein Cmr3 n=1 Tax=Clostridium simiarum TaxID=2841506 RepID=A0ABS6F470_9CLOT|nr:type III-B CRISPR module-associated Cmr3 family protein [Clostridium simiarum]MBU5593311.1 CRISPR-associated protein Cmr3 [Clostridium simiarum]
MGKYLVKLKPVESFFFGGERGFDFYENDTKAKNNIVKSKEFPQQSSILGMIRKEILVLNGLLNEKWDYPPHEKEKMEQLIGKKSFNITNPTDDFGIIKTISPVFMVQETQSNDRFLIKIPKDHNQNKDSEKYDPLNFNDSKGSYLKVKTNLSKEVYLPVNFDSKKGLSEDFLDIETGEILAQDKVLIKDSSIGIKLDDNHKTQNYSLFRLERYKFNYDKNYEKSNKCFGFILDIDEKDQPITFNNYKNIVNLGGESSYFSMSFENINFDLKDKVDFENKKNILNEPYCKIILLSDTYISKDAYEQNCIYSISKKIDFRTLSSENYNSNKEKGKPYYKRFEKSKNRYSLLEKGSVLFTNKDRYHELIESINNSNFQKIGYNIFI